MNNIKLYIEPLFVHFGFFEKTLLHCYQIWIQFECYLPQREMKY
jgi:hypothetical protein